MSVYYMCLGLAEGVGSPGTGGTMWVLRSEPRFSAIASALNL